LRYSVLVYIHLHRNFLSAVLALLAVLAVSGKSHFDEQNLCKRGVVPRRIARRGVNSLVFLFAIHGATSCGTYATFFSISRCRWVFVMHLVMGLVYDLECRLTWKWANRTFVVKNSFVLLTFLWFIVTKLSTVRKLIVVVTRK